MWIANFNAFLWHICSKQVATHASNTILVCNNGQHETTRLVAPEKNCHISFVYLSRAHLYPTSYQYFPTYLDSLGPTHLSVLHLQNTVAVAKSLLKFHRPKVVLSPLVLQELPTPKLAFFVAHIPSVRILTFELCLRVFREIGILKEIRIWRIWSILFLYVYFLYMEYFVYSQSIRILIEGNVCVYLFIEINWRTLFLFV